jgi:glutaminyl-tRNA synthetase
MHWVSAADAVPAEVRVYNHLFSVSQPDSANFASQFNSDSLEILSGCMVESLLETDNSEGAVQFERLGYFCRDTDSAPGKLVFNRTVGLRDTWAKLQR